MSDVDKLQLHEEAAAQRAEDAQKRRRASDVAELRELPLRPTATAGRSMVELPLDRIHPGDNVRLDMPEIQELARSIREVGLLTPLLVRPWNTDSTADGRLPAGNDAGASHYRLIAGHRRHAALVALRDADIEGFDPVRCEVRDGLTEAEAYALMLTENVQRVPLEPIQAARALRLLLDLNEGLDVGTLARSLGLKPAWAKNHLKLLDLPQEVLDRLDAGDLSMTVADLLRRGQESGRIDEERAIELARSVAQRQITTAQVRAEAMPPRRPNTEAPTAVRLGADGMLIEPVGFSNRPYMAEREFGERFERPAAAAGGVTQAVSSPPLVGQPFDPEVESQREPELPVGELMDIYLLDRALRDWATDDYLDELGIDRVQTEAYARALDCQERVEALGNLVTTLMQADRALVPTTA